jgi:sulfotransferase family protein
MSNPYVFIVGCPRSGTSLLQRVLDAHPQLAVMPEAHWIYQLGKQHTEVTPERTLEESIVPRLLDHPKFSGLGIARDQLIALIQGEQHLAYATFVQRIFDLYGQRQGKNMVGNKTPALVRRLELIHNLWPEARIVHLIRDGRDVFLSMKNRPLRNWDLGAGVGWREDPVSAIGLWWELNVEMGRKAGKMLGPRIYYEMFYETFVASPASACSELCRFLEIPFSDAMLRFYERGKTTKASRPITPGLRNWRTEMSTEEVEAFESAAGRLLEGLGYSRLFSHLRRELVDRSTRKRGLLLAQSPRYARAFEGIGARG